VTPLERLGLEGAAASLTGSRMAGSLLVVLLDGRGRQVGFDVIAAARRPRFREQPVSRASVQVRICILRSALADLGLTDAIKTCGIDSPSSPATGYALPEPGRSRVMELLMEEAG